MFRPGRAARAVLLGLALVGVGVRPAAAQPVLLHTWDFLQCGAPATELARLIQDCMQRVMYPRWPEGGQQPDVDMYSAALLCRGTRNTENGRALSTCVRALLYERSGLGSRRDLVSGEVAALACRYATSVPQAEHVEDCMRRLLYTRSGLGNQRTEMAPETAAQLCQSVALPLPAFPFTPLCAPPGGDEAVRFLEECVKRLLYQRDGLGSPRPDMTPEAAALACEGALSWTP